MGIGKKAALWGDWGRDGGEDCCGQHVIKHMALTATSTGQCPYPGISIHFTYSLVSQYNVFPHLRHEVPQGKIQNLITMQIQLGCWDAALLLLPSPNPSFLCLEITWVCSCTFPCCLLKYVSTSQKHYWTLQMGILA